MQRTSIPPKFGRGGRGQSLPEYALVTALVGLIMILGLVGLGHSAGSGLSESSSGLVNYAYHP